MRLSRFELAANLSLLFTEVPLLERPAAARAAGFDSVEMWWPFPSPTPSTAEVDEFLSALSASSVSLIALNFYAGDMPAGERGILSNPALTELFADNVVVMRRIAEATGCVKFNAPYGKRNTAFSDDEQAATARSNLELAVSELESLHPTVLLEPLFVPNYPSYALLTADDAQNVIDRLSDRAASSVRLLFDTYHLSLNGEDLTQVIRKFGAKIGHVQFADAPDRGEPGSGTVDFASVTTELDENGYDGLVALEYVPTTRTTDTFGWIDPLRAQLKHSA